MRTVRYTIEKTWQVQQYEPLKIIVEGVDELQEGETHRDGFKRVFAEVDAAFANRKKLIEGDSQGK